jgi:anti-repressor protein
MNNLSIIKRDGILVVDSRLVAARLAIKHKNFLATIDKYLSQIESYFGAVAFETREFKTKQGNSSTERLAWLTEEQSTFLMTLSRNTEEVVQCKLALVQAFSKAKQLIQQTIPAQNQELERLRLELELIRAKQRYQDSAQAVLVSSSPAMLAYLRGDSLPPVRVEYRDRFIDSSTGKPIESQDGRSLTKLIADAGLNPKSSKDRQRVKDILRACGLDYDRGKGWTTTAYLNSYKVLSDEVYDSALKTVLAELTTPHSQQNLFVYQFQRHQ